MSKKQVLLVVGLAVLATPALATKARLEALGQDGQYGSFYVRDTRDVFGNPAYVTTHKDYVVMEVGAGQSSDSSSDPRGEAGFFRGWGNFAYGLYLGNDQDFANRASDNFHMYNSSEITFGSTADKNFLAPDNTVSLFFGGDSGIQWGASFYMSRDKTNGDNDGSQYFDYNNSDSAKLARVERKHLSYGTNLGAVIGNIEAYGRFAIHDKSEGALTTSDEFKADLGYTLGASYSMMGWTFAGEYASSGFEATAADAGSDGVGDDDSFTKREQDSKTWWLGAGRVNEINDKARFFADFKFTRTSTEDKYAHLSTITTFGHTNTSRPTVTKTYSAPLTLGIEADATSWLTIRGSAKQNIWSTTLSADSVRTVQRNNIAVALGSTLNFGQLKIDGLIGTDNDANGTASDSGNGILRLDSLMSRIAAHYWF